MDKRAVHKASEVRKIDDMLKIGCLNYTLELTDLYTLEGSASNIHVPPEVDALDGLVKFSKPLQQWELGGNNNCKNHSLKLTIL